MIKTKVNRHDLEYYVYAMVKSFYKNADIIAPDTLEHNLPLDDEDKEDDVVECYIDESVLVITVKKGKYLSKSVTERYKLISEEDADLKDEIRGLIYDFLCEYSDKILPWGNLTGIRPTKLYMNAMESMSREETIAFMKDKHRVSDKKGTLAYDIALREKTIIDGCKTYKDDGYSLYIGIPFCPSTCLYCSFTSYPIFSYKDKIDAYLDAVIKELTAVRNMMPDSQPDSIYIGGGTPTSLPAEKLSKLLYKIGQLYDVGSLKEYTVEAGRADSITIDKLRVLKDSHVSRISVNPQTMKDKTLKAIGRHHTSADVIRAIEDARRIGINNINMDIILGLTGETLSDVNDTLSEIEKLCPESLTVHSLAVKRASRLKQSEGGLEDIYMMNMDEAMDLAIASASKMGLNPYYLYRQKDMGGNLENTGFAKEGMYGVYNILMMEEVQSIIACGAGTVSKRVYQDGHIDRCDTAKDVNMYINRIDEMIKRKVELWN